MEWWWTISYSPGGVWPPASPLPRHLRGDGHPRMALSIFCPQSKRHFMGDDAGGSGLHSGGVQWAWVRVGLCRLSAPGEGAWPRFSAAQRSRVRAVLSSGAADAVSLHVGPRG